MATSTPIVKSVRAIPVAGHDSMLLNLSGAHGPYFTRNLLVIEDNSGNIGVGEIPGGEKILNTLNDAKALIEGQPIGEYKNLLKKFKRLLPTVIVVGVGTRLLICVQLFMLSRLMNPLYSIYWAAFKCQCRQFVRRWAATY